MPGFVKTPKDEARWSKAKEAAGKTTQTGSEGYWKLSNYIFHRMGKSEEDQKKAEMYKKELLGQSEKEFQKSMKMSGLKPTAITPVPGVVSPANNNTGSPNKVGSQAVVKAPKAKKMGQATDKPSVFYKSEQNQSFKKQSIKTLHEFLTKQKAKK